MDYRKHSIPFGVGILTGIMILVFIRAIGMPIPVATHFHANFAMFVNGKQVDFSSDKYMEDVEGCRPEYLAIQPKERTHQHNHEGDVVHVHHEGVTWGHFMSNIKVSFGRDYLITDAGGIYKNAGVYKMKYFLNGEMMENPWNVLIRSEDKLLISYGWETIEQVKNTQYTAISSTAHEHNDHPDPGSCSGEISLPFFTRLKKAFLW